MQESRKTALFDAVGPWGWEFEQNVRSIDKGQGRIQEFLIGGGGGGWYQSAAKLPGSQSIKIGIDLSIEKSIKIGKSDLIDIDSIDQSIEIDDTLVSFIDSSTIDFTDFIDLYRKFICSSVHPKMKTDFMQTVNLLTIELQLRVERSNNYHLKKVFFCLGSE